jgi:hypothetical protein
MTAFPESRLAADFIRAVFDDAREMLPHLCRSCEEFLFPLNLVDTSTAALDLGLATIAIELEALPNLFPASTASRLREKVLTLVAKIDESEYPLAELASYHDIFNESVQHGWNPLEEVCERLLHRFTHAEASYGGEAFVVDPIRTAVISTYIVGTLGRWKLSRDAYEIIED